MSSSNFSHTERFWMCASCGAPQRIPIEGGSIDCNFCGVSTALAPRREKALAGADVNWDEDARVARLRKADRGHAPPPPTLPLKLMVWLGERSDARFGLALDTWQAARANIEAGTSGENDEAHVYVVGRALASYWAEHDEIEPQRAVLETSLELCATANHKQLLRCALASCALSEDDPDAASAWLETCNARPDDLTVDSAWRHVNAQLASSRGDYATVLDVLGRDPSLVPVSEMFEQEIALLRADALERTGDVAAASAALDRAMDRHAGPPRGFRALAREAGDNLCPKTLATAYNAAMRRWTRRYYLFLAVWIGAINYFTANWMGDLGRFAFPVRNFLPVIVVVALGMIPFNRWRP